jgi:outer membrane receptor protein involved in Fe transport
VSGVSTYTNALPSVSLRYRLGDSTNLRAVYGWLIGRPDYGVLAPSFFVNPDRKEIDAGNPNLKPTQSRSYDLLFEHFFGTVGVVSGGAFYKDLKDRSIRARSRRFPEDPRQVPRSSRPAARGQDLRLRLYPAAASPLPVWPGSASASFACRKLARGVRPSAGRTGAPTTPLR